MRRVVLEPTGAGTRVAVRAGRRCPMASHLRDDVQALTKDIRALRDEVRLKVHLAGMDLQTEWQIGRAHI